MTKPRALFLSLPLGAVGEPVSRSLKILLAVLPALMLPRAEAQGGYEWSSLAGATGGFGHIDASGTEARFFYPRDVAVDGSGNVYVAESNNHVIRKITSAGAVSTLAGMPRMAGREDGTGSSARFMNPWGIAVDSSGNAYVTDLSSPVVRKVTPAGVVTNFAGSPSSYGDTDATGGAARFTMPGAITVDGSGNLYVCDYDKLRKITPAGVVSTISAPEGQQLTGIAVDGSGNIFLCCSTIIYKRHSTGIVTNFAGNVLDSGSANGSGPAARFNYAEGLACDGSGNVYVADTGNHTIRRISTSGVVTTVAGSAGMEGSVDGAGSAARFSSPTGVRVNSSGHIFVADSSNQLVRKITGTTVSTLAGRAGNRGIVNGSGAAARFYWPGRMTMDGAGNLYVGDLSADVIRRVEPSGATTTFTGEADNSGPEDGTLATASFGGLGGGASDPAGNIYFCDNHTIRKISNTGEVTTFAGGSSRGSTDATGKAASFSVPDDIVRAPNGNLYVADTGNSTIRQITPAGVVTTFAGSPDEEGSADGTGAAARFREPRGITADTAGNLYVADTLNHTIRKITPGRVVTTVAGSALSPGNSDGAGAAARLFYPLGITADASGNVFVADTHNHAIRRISPDHWVTTVSIANGVNGSTTAGLFSYPQDVEISAAGALYVLDWGNHRIVRGTPYSPAQIFSAALSQAGLTGADAEAGAVPYRDGVPNLLKYAFNLNLKGVDHRYLQPGSGVAGIPAISTLRSGGNATLKVEYLRRIGSGLTYTPQKSPSLAAASWVTLASPPIVTRIDSNWERVVHEEVINTSTQPRYFTRVKVTVPD